MKPMNKQKFNDYVSRKTKINGHLMLIDNFIPLEPPVRVISGLGNVCRSAELGLFVSMFVL